MILAQLKEDYTENKEQIIQTAQKIENLLTEPPEQLEKKIAVLAEELEKDLEEVVQIKKNLEEKMRSLEWEIPKEFLEFHSELEGFINELSMFLEDLRTDTNSKNWNIENDNRGSDDRTWFNEIQSPEENAKIISSNFNLKWKSADLQFVTSKADAKTWKVRSFATWVGWSLKDKNVNYKANYKVDNSEWYKDDKNTLMDEAKDNIEYLIPETKDIIDWLKKGGLKIRASDVTDLSKIELEKKIKPVNEEAYIALKEYLDLYQDAQKDLN